MKNKVHQPGISFQFDAEDLNCVYSGDIDANRALQIRSDSGFKIMAGALKEQQS
jgi:hypothetical protein